MSRVVVLLNEGDDRRFEAYCEAKGHKKSPLIVRLIREHLDREGFVSQPGLFDPAKVGAPKRERTRAASRGGRPGEGNRS